MKITALGTQGWIPSLERHGLALAVETRQELILLDLGTGVARLMHDPWRTQIRDRYQTIQIVLSHFHIDHIIGLSYLSGIMQDKTITIHGPGALLGGNTRDYLEHVFRPPFSSETVGDWRWLAEIKELQLGSQHIGRTLIRTRRQQHPGGSIGFVIDDRFAYITDTPCDPETTAFIDGCQLLYHECWYLQSVDANDHAHLPGVLAISEQAAVREVGLIHLHPQRSAAEYAAAIQTTPSTIPVHVVNDGEVAAI